MTTPLAAKIAREYGTPCAVIDMDRVERQHRAHPGDLRCRRCGQPTAHQDPQEPAAGDDADQGRRQRHHLPETRRGRGDGRRRDRRHPDQLQSDRRREDGAARRAAGQGQHDGGRRQFRGRRSLPKAAAISGRPLSVVVECDTGRKRAGVETPAEAIALAREIAASKGLHFRGLHAVPDRNRLGRGAEILTTKRSPACARTGSTRPWSRPAARRT